MVKWLNGCFVRVNNPEMEKFSNLFPLKTISCFFHKKQSP